VGWEERGGKLYYYRSVRDGKRVNKEYVGRGELAEAFAHADEAIRRAHELGRVREREERERLEDLAAPALEVGEAATVLARASLVALGYHEHHGEWRRRREFRDSA
jgi:hypothetical protein